MGFSVSAAAAIIGVTLIMAVGSLTAELLPSLTETNDSFASMKERAIARVQTDIAIKNVSTPANGSNYDLNFIVENMGSVTLKTRYFTILINGTQYHYSSTSDYLYLTGEVNFSITNLSGSGTRRLKVITENGIATYYDYTIT
ncbi:MAG: hypothetical protein JW771_07195 [Candidatus Thermoplasmatota archaeon]|nr:hypothetical protein [Candidatus Thermoplasmatota archaeon]